MPNDTNAARGYRSNATKFLRFPIERSNALKSKIVFQPYQVIGSSFKFTRAERAANNFADEFGGKKLPKKAPDVTGATAIKLNPLQEVVQLFLPLQFSVRDGIQYTDASLGLFGGQAYNTIASGGTLSAGILETIQGFGDSLVGLFDTLSGRQQLGAVAAARAAQLPAVPQVARDIIGLAGRVAINPNTRTVFNGVTTRDFLFQFDFYPKSEKESEELYEIIKSFRLNAYPGREPGTGFVPVAYKYPNIYKIRLLSGVNDDKRFVNVGTPIKFSYLQNIEANYSRNQGEGLFKNGAPTHVQLSLNFKEYKALDRDDILNELNNGFYDYEGQKSL